LPPPHSTFGGCGLPRCQIAEQQKTYDNGSKKLPDPSSNYNFETLYDTGSPGKERGLNMADCIFCKIVKGDIPCTKVYENETVLAFADINPIAEGHTLIIPKNHTENIWEISGDDLSAIHLASIKVAKAMRAALNSAGIALLQLNGRAVNQVVMHYHLHLIPRRADDPKLALTSWELKPGDMKAIEETASKIATEIK
jgi:histidine triad (HIT) family protein